MNATTRARDFVQLLSVHAFSKQTEKIQNYERSNDSRVVDAVVFFPLSDQLEMRTPGPLRAPFRKPTKL